MIPVFIRHGKQAIYIFAASRYQQRHRRLVRKASRHSDLLKVYHNSRLKGTKTSLRDNIQQHETTPPLVIFQIKPMVIDLGQHITPAEMIVMASARAC